MRLKAEVMLANKRNIYCE